MPKISVAIATHNEAENITKCLLSVIHWVDEIVVADAASTDKTLEILKKYSLHIIPVAHIQMFHINKQKAINACRGDWILQLDADEVVTNDLKDEILQVLKEQITNNKKQINGYWMPRKNFFLGRFLSKGGQYPDYTLRLYRRGKGYLPCKSVHEQAVVSGPTGYLHNALLHYPYPDFAHYLDHFNLYTDIFAQELKDKHESTGIIAIFHHMVIKPKWWFLTTYFRHKGFLDGFPGFIFSLFSALRFPVAFVKYWEMRHINKHG